MQRLYTISFIFGMLIFACFADDEREWNEKAEKAAEDSKLVNVLGDTIKGFGDWLQNTAQKPGLKIAESGVETMKEFSDQAREKSETGMEAAKGIAAGIGDRLSKAKETIQENGEKMKEAFSGAVEKSKDEFETAASKVSKHAKEASDSVFSLFKLK